MIHPVTVTDSGRMNLPAEMRKRLGVPPTGGTVWAEETPEGILIRNVSQLAAVSQGLAGRYLRPDPAGDPGGAASAEAMSGGQVEPVSP